MIDSLQDLFLERRGDPIEVDGRLVVQMDRVDLQGAGEVEIVFAGTRPFHDNAAVLAIDQPSAILLSDGSRATAVVIWDEPGLPRTVVHRVESADRPLFVYNKYRTRHGPDFVTEDSFTGNASMIVTSLSPHRRKYECSNGPGQFSPDDLIFELRWERLGE
jgi:hypothetical protein